MPKRVIVIGAGIVGSSIAYHLARAGADVLVLDDQSHAGGLATPQSWAWLNASWGNDKEYVALRMHSMQLWHELDKQVAGLAVNWCGSVLWDLPPDKLHAFVEEHKSWGYPVKLIGKSAVARLEPNLKYLPDHAARVESEGAVEPRHAVEQLIAAARGAGADVIYRANVRRLNEEEGRITGVTTAEGALQADEVVIAAGIDCGRMLDSIGLNLQLEQPAGLLVHSKPAPELLNGIVLAPNIHVRQTAEGRLVAGSDFAGADPEDKPQEVATALHAKLATLIAGAEDIELDHFTVGLRPTPPDGIPAFGRIRSKQGLYLAVMHSAMTLAPVIGELARREILNDDRDTKLERYLPDRLLK